MRRSAFFALAVLFTVTAGAATIRRYSLDEVRDRSSLIFTGHVLSSSTRSVLDGRAVTTIEGLADGGQVKLPLTDQPWGTSGWLTDKFGINWNLDIQTS